MMKKEIDVCPDSRMVFLRVVTLFDMAIFVLLGLYIMATVEYGPYLFGGIMIVAISIMVFVYYLTGHHRAESFRITDKAITFRFKRNEDRVVRWSEIANIGVMNEIRFYKGKIPVGAFISLTDLTQIRIDENAAIEIISAYEEMSGQKPVMTPNAKNPKFWTIDTA